MPSGARKRKAAKKKGKKGDAHHDSDNRHPHTDTSSSHSHGIDDHKSGDSRESDREEGEGSRDEELVDRQREGDFVKRDEALEEEIVQVEVESKPPRDDSSSTDVAMKTQAVPLISEESVPGNDVEDKDHAVVEEEISIQGDDLPKAFDYIPEKEVVAGGNPVGELHKLSVEERIRDDELVKEVVTLAQEVIPGAETSVIADAVNSELMNNEKAALQASSEKEMPSSTLEDQQLEGIEPQVGSVDGDKFLVGTIVSTSGVVDAVKPIESDKQMEEQQVGAQGLDTLKNRETHMQSHGNVGAAVPKTSHEVDNGKDSETPEQLEKQPLIVSNPLPVRRTSWLGCCGLLEVFSAANR